MTFELTMTVEAPDDWNCGDVGGFVDDAVALQSDGAGVSVRQLHCKKQDQPQ